MVEGHTNASFQIDKDDFWSQSNFIFCLNEKPSSYMNSKRRNITHFTKEIKYCYNRCKKRGCLD